MPHLAFWLLVSVGKICGIPVFGVMDNLNEPEWTLGRREEIYTSTLKMEKVGLEQRRRRCSPVPRPGEDNSIIVSKRPNHLPRLVAEDPEDGSVFCLKPGKCIQEDGGTNHTWMWVSLRLQPYCLCEKNIEWEGG